MSQAKDLACNLISLFFAARLYNNRCACYLKVGNYLGALDDASTALDLLKPAVESNAKDHAKALVRRSVAFTELGLPKKALIELDAAIKIMPDHDGLKSDRERLMATIKEMDSEE